GLFYFKVIDRDGLNVSSGTFTTIIVCALFMAVVAGFLFSAVAGYMAGLVGSSNNPISGITIATILTTSLILFALLGASVEAGAQSVAAAATAILVGGVVCCAAAISGDNLQDLKSGHLLGATPWKQQVMQIVGVLGAALVIAPVLSLLYNAYGMGESFPRPGMDPKEALAAPQATLMYSVATGVFEQQLEWGMIRIGVYIALAILVLDQVLKARKAKFRAPVLAVAVGIYLPLELSVPIFLGGLVSLLTQRALAKRGPEAQARGNRVGLLLASGLIAGEAIMGILLAVPFAIFQRTDVLKISAGEGLGLLVLGFFVAWIYRKVVQAGSASGS
ncbi:MAG: oligopeptide transporter, OPT family, partial [Verrucomicrobiota bacterium]